MAQFTRTETLTENEYTQYRSSWTIEYNTDNILVSGASFRLPGLNIRAKYTYSGKNYAYAIATHNVIINNTTTVSGGRNEKGTAGNLFSWSSGTWNNVPVENDSHGDYNTPILTESLFTSNNPTQRSVTLQYKLTGLRLGSQRGNEAADRENSYSWDGNWNIFTTSPSIILDAPPTHGTITLTKEPSGYIYAGLTKVTANIPNIQAQYGGNITSISFTIGNQTVTKDTENFGNLSGNQTLEILLNTAGTFTPTITITDSREQITTRTFSDITVNGYTAPTVNFTVERTKGGSDAGIIYDEGTFVTAPTTLIYDNLRVNNHLEAPTVAVEGVQDTDLNVTWYSTRATSGQDIGKLSGLISDWSGISSNTTVYALLRIQNNDPDNGGFDLNTSYTISITPQDAIGSGTIQSQTLSTAFFTIDILAEGHGIAFGQPASTTGFYVNMDTHLLQGLNVIGNTTVSGTIESLDAYIDIPNYSSSGTDKAIYDALDSLGWKNDVAPNDTPIYIKELLAKLINIVSAPRIIEQGTSGIWTYRKWSDGTAECWGVYADSIAITSTWGSIYWGQLTGIPDFPTQLTFQYNPLVEMSTMASNGNAWSTGNLTALSTTNCGTLMFFSAAQQNSITVRANLHVIGKWSTQSQSQS